MSSTTAVWPLAVRVFHWSLVGSFATAWLTGDDWMTIHEWAGYAAAALVALRVAYGLVGPRYVRFSQFVRSPAVTWTYARQILRKREPRYIGHNPLGAIMVLVLLAAISTTALTGWLQTTDAYWGVEWIEDIHEAAANGMLVLVAVHVGGVLISSFRHHENLIRAMISGRKVSPSPGDVA